MVSASNEVEKASSVSEDATSNAIEPQDDGQAARLNSSARAKWTTRLNPLKTRTTPLVPSHRQPSREFSAGFISKVLFHWLTPLMKVGYQRPLQLNDIWHVNPKRSTLLLEKRFSATLQALVAQQSKRPLLYALLITFKKELLIGAFCEFLATVSVVMLPFVLKYLIAFATEAFNAHHTASAEPSLGYGIGLVMAFTAIQIVTSVAINHFVYLGMSVGGEARAVLMSVIFDKAIKISGRAKAGGRLLPLNHIAPSGNQEQESNISEKEKSKNEKNKIGAHEMVEGWSNGRIVNLMSTDTSRIDLASGMLHILWGAPLTIVITMVILLINLSYSALPGITLLFLSLPVLGAVAKALFRRRMAINKITDQRVGLTQEILQAMRFVKYFGWETNFQNRINGIRKREIKSIQLLLATRDGLNALFLSMPVFASMLSFITFSLSKNTLHPAAIFSSLALFNELRVPLNMFPLVLGRATDALTSIKRIEEFLLAEELIDDSQYDQGNANAIVVNDATFTWEKVQGLAKEDDDDGDGDSGAAMPSSSAEPFQVPNLNLTIGRSELVAIIGSVGSGKTSLLAALAGEMRKTSGSVTFGAGKAVCSQNTWIQNSSLRDNIVFGTEFDATRYAKVIESCALRQDFQMLPDGDNTEIGERGVNISGGQKQRVSIARAIYFNADIILMDDPLSAVDARVGQQIMEEAICGLLANKCRILATHQLHVLPRCDKVIWLEDGCIKAHGSYPELMAQNAEFVELMTLTSVNEQSDGDEQVRKSDENEAIKPVVELVEAPKNKIALMQQESQAVGAVAWGVYKPYLRAAGPLFVIPLVLIALTLSQGSNIVTGLWLSWWTSKKFPLSNGTYIEVYAGLGSVQAVLMFLFAASVSVFGTHSSKVMFNRALTRVLRAPVSFFETTPLGRLLNLFSKDVDVMDSTLTDSIWLYSVTVTSLLATVALIVAYFYYFIVAIVPMVLVVLFAGSYYTSSAREIKRHEAVLRSHVFAKFNEAVYGTTTIRAYGLQSQFSQVLKTAIDEYNGAYFLTFANQRWMTLRLDAVGLILIFVLSMLIVTSRFTVNPSIGGLVLSYMINIMGSFQVLVRQMAEVENSMNSTERMHHYATQIEEEAPLEIGKVPESWPTYGEIVFDNIQMRYRAGLPLVLKNVSLHVQPGESLGVVGRTGAGKSSIMNTMFRLVELSGGSITIDGVDISKIGLRQLRSRLAIIPQDPTLFKGTVRSNLDPFNERTDSEIWSALRQVDLVRSGGEPGVFGLETVVDEEGLNFSLGQRQLMALARALVRDAKIIVCDEATSSVDFVTDQKVQRSMEAFRGKTLLCIAHRLRTIIGYDRICVLDHGTTARPHSKAGYPTVGPIAVHLRIFLGVSTKRNDHLLRDTGRLELPTPIEYERPFLEKLPFGYGDFVKYTKRGWNWSDKSEAHQKFGSVFIVVTPTGNDIHVGDATATDSILSRRKDFVKPLELAKLIDVFGQSVISSEGSDWQRHRRITAPPFNERNSRLVWVEAMRQSKQMLEHWNAKEKGANITTTLQDTAKLALNVLMGAGFGTPYSFRDSLDITKDGFNMTYRDALKTSSAKINASEDRPAEASLLSTLVQKAQEADIGNVEGDTQSENSLSDSEIYGNLFMFSFAGHETMAMTLAYATYLFAAFPEWQAWVGTEIDEVFKEHDNIESLDYEKLYPKLKRCRAVMHEVLRLYPPALSLPKFTGNVAATLKVDERVMTIPPDTHVYPNVIALHTNPAYWGEDCLMWKPSRWIRSNLTPPTASAMIDVLDSEELVDAPVKGSYIPWADGPRICPGKKFSQVEFVAAISVLLWKHRISINPRPGETLAQARKPRNGKFNVSRKALG
ncbi:Multidrug resistance fer6 [Hyphodiscus hymeniophilus]|uniref:Multidrug resistance fer6 n=1 Tax=Hyphodiscus hymeniophilus TaxID=353542 RepID=A0A9P7AVF7_9HELO|nr:Multidrug resistance fer6 [Hyphodiscus hymeniophilus]